MAASLIASGTAKSGCPIDRLIGFAIFAARSNTLRMPELSNFAVRSANQGCADIKTTVGRTILSVRKKMAQTCVVQSTDRIVRPTHQSCNFGFGLSRFE